MLQNCKQKSQDYKKKTQTLRLMTFRFQYVKGRKCRKEGLVSLRHEEILTPFLFPVLYNWEVANVNTKAKVEGSLCLSEEEIVCVLCVKGGGEGGKSCVCRKLSGRVGCSVKPWK